MGKRDLIRQANKKALAEKQAQEQESTTIVDDLVKQLLSFVIPCYRSEKTITPVQTAQKKPQESKNKDEIAKKVSEFMASRPGVGRPKMYTNRRAMSLKLEPELYEYVMKRGIEEFGSGTGFIAYLIAKDERLFVILVVFIPPFITSFPFFFVSS